MRVGCTGGLEGKLVAGSRWGWWSGVHGVGAVAGLG